MRRKTPRPANPYRDIYKSYADTQMTLEEILVRFDDYAIYSTIDCTEIHIVDANDKEYLFFESIGYDDEDCVPTIYEASPYMGFGKDFNEIVNIYLDNNFTITALN